MRYSFLFLFFIRFTHIQSVFQIVQSTVLVHLFYNFFFCKLISKYITEHNAGMLAPADFYGQPMPLAPVAGSYMCQTSPPQTSVQPAIGFPAFVPQPPPHDIPLMKTQIIQSAFSPSPPANVIRLPIPAKYMRILQNPLKEYNRDGIVTTCSKCNQKNTLLELKMDEMFATLKEYHELKSYLQQQIHFQPFPEEEHPMAIVNSLNYTQLMDLPKISNLRANANEFTPAQVIEIFVIFIYSGKIHD